MWEKQPFIPPLDPSIDEDQGVVYEYQILKKIGRGEFASVMECRKSGETRTLAAKMIHKEKVRPPRTCRVDPRCSLIVGVACRFTPRRT